MNKVILAVLGLGLLCVLSIACMWATGLIREVDPAANDGVFALQTVHRSTASKLQDEAASTAMVFADNTRALVAEDLFDNRRLYLVNLETTEVSEIELPPAERLPIRRFLYAEDVVYAIFGGKTVAEHNVYRIDRDGNIRPVTFVEYFTVTTTEEPVNADEITPLLLEGKLEDLTELQEEICKPDAATGQMRSTGVSLVHYFFNEEYLLETNISTMKETLRSRAVRTLSQPCERASDLLEAGLRLELVRSGTNTQSYRSDLDNRIVTARLYREETLLHEYRFGEQLDFYFWVVPVGNRLYFVGNHVKYLDLDQLPEER